MCSKLITVLYSRNDRVRNNRKTIPQISLPSTQNLRIKTCFCDTRKPSPKHAHSRATCAPSDKLANKWKIKSNYTPNIFPSFWQGSNFDPIVFGADPFPGHIQTHPHSHGWAQKVSTPQKTPPCSVLTNRVYCFWYWWGFVANGFGWVVLWQPRAHPRGIPVPRWRTPPVWQPIEKWLIKSQPPPGSSFTVLIMQTYSLTHRGKWFSLQSHKTPEKGEQQSLQIDLNEPFSVAAVAGVASNRSALLQTLLGSANEPARTGRFLNWVQGTRVNCMSERIIRSGFHFEQHSTKKLDLTRLFSC